MGSSGAVNTEKNIVLFDGICNLCNGAVQFIIRCDPTGKFQFASLQSPVAQQLLKDANVPNALETIILIRNRLVFERSDAALEIARGLSGAWSLLYGFKIVPRFLRDSVYDWIAKNRYRFFGKRNECMIPTPELKYRFIDGPAG
jgi:predicted DCC family thiol-disulfide oxidoreductase YuxK